jgi:hypothetical protein
MKADRRSLLKLLSIVPLAAVPLAGLFRAEVASADVLRFVADDRFPEGKSLAAVAQREGYAVANPGGEIVSLFLGQGASWLADDGAIVGITSYTDMMLMRDLARNAGRRMRYASALAGGAPALVDRLDGGEASFVASLRSPTMQPGKASAFLWMV